MRSPSCSRRPDARHLGTILALVLALLPGTAPAADAPRSAGPPAGALIVIGGGTIGPTIRAAAAELDGGANARWVVIPTADTDRDLETSTQASLPAQLHRSFTVLHTRDRGQADAPDFAAPLAAATAVWFDGGRQWRLVDAYAGTRTERAIRAVLARGGLIAGTSAGATIQGDYLVRGDPRGNAIMMSPGHERGFAYLVHVAIDQHVLVRHRETDLVPVVAAHPGLLGIGIDEGTAIVVRGNRFAVIGRSKVLITDGADHAGVPYATLIAGDRFDLATWTKIPP